MSLDQLTFTGTLKIRKCWCGIRHAIPEELDNEIRRNPKQGAYCPVGHSYVHAGKSHAEEMEELEAQKVHLADQLGAAKVEAEKLRVTLLRDRDRWAKGMCPCCRRNFPSLAQHVRTEHPEYDISEIKRPVYKCSCFRVFGTLKGLRVHQGHQRPDDWATQPRYWAHLTVTE